MKFSELIKKPLKMRLDSSARISRDITKMLKAYGKGWKFHYLLLHELIYRRYGCCISPRCSVDPSVSFPHPTGIVIGDGVVVGPNCTIYQNVTLGRANKHIPLYPCISEGCVLYANSVIVGDVLLQPFTSVAANAVVTRSNRLEKDVLVGIPARSKYDR